MQGFLRFLAKGNEQRRRRRSNDARRNVSSAHHRHPTFRWKSNRTENLSLPSSYSLRGELKRLTTVHYRHATMSDSVERNASMLNRTPKRRIRYGYRLVLGRASETYGFAPPSSSSSSPFLQRARTHRSSRFLVRRTVKNEHATVSV